MSALRKLASHTIIYGFANIAARLLNFFLTPFYTRFFTPIDYGTIALVYAYLSFFNIIFTYGMETGFFYFVNKEEKPRLVGGTTFLALLSSSIVFSALIIIFSPYIAQWIHYPNHPEYVVFMALILVFDTLLVIPFAWYRKSGRAGKFAILKFFAIVLNVVFNILFLVILPQVLQQPGSVAYSIVDMLQIPGNEISYVFIANLLSSLVILLFTLPDIFKEFELKLDIQLWKRIFKYSWPLLILGLAGMVNETFDRILLDWRLTGSEAERQYLVGVYSACYKLSIFMTIAIQSFRYAAEPFFFAELKKDGAKVVYARILKYFTYITALIFLGIMLYMDIFIKIIGNDFREARNVVPVLLMANLFLGAFVYLSQWYKQTEKTIIGAYISIGGSILTLIVNYIFIPTYGYMASAWATFLCYFLMAIATYLLGQKYYPVNYPIGRIIFYIGSAVAMYFLSHYIQEKFIGKWNTAMFLINTLFIALYILLFLYLERQDLKPQVILSKFRKK